MVTARANGVRDVADSRCIRTPSTEPALDSIGWLASHDDAVAFPNLDIQAVRYLLRFIDSLLIGSARQVQRGSGNTSVL